ncbi:hypothetical protein [Kordiimonas aestuarii]|uniref:hypothetical protein n=1 Tax=Kordiimonas aestuarii TaxID=1005925 RepID=UPI0021D0D88C|nr:hypothetical protein [Kordiimonas aestuarii]
MRKLCVICAIIVPVLCNAAYAQNDVFLEGLPDVPQLEMVIAIEGDPVIFDTPSGTVAEYTFLLSGTSDDAIKAYNAALTGLGWACIQNAEAMTCAREENRLVFTKPEETPKDHRIILRLEPVE